MPDEKKRLFLFEALELRAEYDARIKTLRDCLPETRKRTGGFSYLRNGEKRTQPSPDFDVRSAREQVKNLEYKKRKINAAIQKANFEHVLEYETDSITLQEALETRKNLNKVIGELHSQLVDASFQHIIYKEDRDIVEPNEFSYKEVEQELNETRLKFRKLNRKIRHVSFSITIDFIDEN
jgi:hypothetical protein